MSRRGRLAEEIDALRRELGRSAAQSSINANELARLRAAIDAMPVGVVVVDSAGGIQLTNHAAGAFAGHTKYLVVEALEQLLSAAAGGVARRQQVEFFGPPRRLIEIEALPLEGGGALATLEDISERSRLDTVRTDFVANISHELKTPIGAMSVLAESLSACLEERDGTVDDIDMARHLARRIEVEALRASQTIDDLLELSRIELGGSSLSESVDVDRLIDDAMSRAAVAAEQRLVRLVRAGTTGLRVLGDSRQLGSALNNLLDNAIKYSEAGGEVTVSSTTEISGHGTTVCLAVIDHGVGIPAADLDRIFERFYRVDRARTRHSGGTGLGLSIVRHVATNHGGEITVESHEGEGSIFTLRLPAREG